MERRILVFEQLGRCIQLQYLPHPISAGSSSNVVCEANLSSVEHEYSVIVNNCVQAMRDGKQRAAQIFYNVLDMAIRLARPVSNWKVQS